jgi:hypothetical protein
MSKNEPKQLCFENIDKPWEPPLPCQTEDDVRLDPVDAGIFLGGSRPIQHTTLSDWRNKRVGPPWVTVEGSIRYYLTDLRNYLRARRVEP